MLVFGTFVLLLGLTLVGPTASKSWQHRTRWDWALDVSGLWLQGLLIPFLQVSLVAGCLILFLPDWRSRLSLPPGLGFFLSFVVVDYLYYWNHRLLHTRWFWPAHRVHHDSRQFDVLMTSRNTLWSPFLIVYLWIHGFFLFVLDQTQGYMLGVAVSAAMDLWRHTRFFPKGSGRFVRGFQKFFVSPRTHAIHHGSSGPPSNFGANWSLWDKLHGTYAEQNCFPIQFGEDLSESADQTKLPGWKKLLFPFA